MGCPCYTSGTNVTTRVNVPPPPALQPMRPMGGPAQHHSTRGPAQLHSTRGPAQSHSSPSEILVRLGRSRLLPLGSPSKVVAAHRVCIHHMLYYKVDCPYGCTEGLCMGLVATWVA